MVVLVNKRVLAIIPARAGSKRLPNKNSLNLNGQPLISWTIQEAKKSNHITDIVVSTDCSKIAKIAELEQAEVPFLRPAELATDTTRNKDVTKHLLEQLLLNGRKYDYFILLQPTSPLRSVEDIDNAFEKINKLNADAIISVCHSEHSPLWTTELDEKGDLSEFFSHGAANKRSQQLPSYYRLNGAIYLISVERFLKEGSYFFTDNIFSTIMPSLRSVDIDNEFDFKLAEFLMKNSYGNDLQYDIKV